MTRRILKFIFLVLLIGGTARAGDVRGKVVKVDAEKHSITVKVDDKEHTLTLADDVKVILRTGKAKKAVEKPVPEGLKGVSKGNEVTLTSLPKDDKVIRVRIEGG